MSDNYEFSKSTAPQGVAMETPYSNKQWNYINEFILIMVLASVNLICLPSIIPP